MATALIKYNIIPESVEDKNLRALAANYEAAIQEAFELFNKEGEVEDLNRIWYVQLPRYDGLPFRRTYFGRNRWFDYSAYSAEHFSLKADAPLFVQKWETWKNPEPFLDLLKRVFPQPLANKLGSNLGALQFVVDVADQLLRRSLLPQDEKSATMIALLTSAASLLKWPMDFLATMKHLLKLRQESVKKQFYLEWDIQTTQRNCLMRCVITSSVTLEIAAKLRNEMILLLSNQILLNECIVASGVVKLPKKEHLAPAIANSMTNLSLTVTLNKRPRDDDIIEEMSKVPIKKH